jgi:hypothetical protein
VELRQIAAERALMNELGLQMADAAPQPQPIQPEEVDA